MQIYIKYLVFSNNNQNPHVDDINARYLFFYNNYSFSWPNIWPGSNGLDSIIIAYENMLHYNTDFDKLIHYSCLFIGDSDTVGSITLA